MMIAPVPICFVAHRRPDHARRALDALMHARRAVESEVYCFIDGAQDRQDEEQVDAVEALCRQPRGFAALHIHRRSRNLGLGVAVIEAIDQVLTRHERVIVVEEDLILAPSALDFLNSALERYAEKTRVMAACGYIFADLRSHVGADAFFSRRGGCWGWATWRDRWALLDRDRTHLLRRVEAAGLRPFFEPEGGVSMIEKVQAGNDPSWSPSWYLSAAVEGRLFLYPSLPLVKNIGFDGSGAHEVCTDAYDVHFGPDIFLTLPAIPQEHHLAEGLFQSFFADARERSQWAMGGL